MNEEMFLGVNGKLLINDFKPSYTITMNHSDGECVGRFDFNGPKLVFTGDAEESAKVFVNYLTMIWEKRLQEEREAEREKVAAWMRARSYATGHGDTIEDLLKELEWQVAERVTWKCAEIAEAYEPTCDTCPSGVANAIQARGKV